MMPTRNDIAQMRAWRVYVKPMGDQPQVIMVASSRSRAVTKVYCSARDAGISVNRPDVRAVRAQEFDSMFEKFGAFCWPSGHYLLAKHLSQRQAG